MTYRNASEGLRQCSGCINSTGIVFLQLPPEVVKYVFLYCDGKSLSALLLATSFCERIRHITYEWLADVVRVRLENIASRVETLAGDNRDGINYRDAATWIYSVAAISHRLETSAISPQQRRCHRIKLLSENMAVVFFLEESLRRFSNESMGYLEWPVWCGQITVESFVTGSRMRNTARVVITSPFQRPSLIPGSNLMKNRTPSGIFRCEPYNMVPVPPWGVVRGLAMEDDLVLKPVADRLVETNFVAIPAGFHSYQVLDVRIATKEQAKHHWWSRICTMKSSWLVLNEPDVPLLCCWHDDAAELQDDRDYVDFIIDLLKANSRLQKSTQTLPREYPLVASRT